MNTYKKCQNENCKKGENESPKWFWGTEKDRYCSPQCYNATNMRKYRAKKKIVKSRAIGEADM